MYEVRKIVLIRHTLTQIGLNKSNYRAIRSWLHGWLALSYRNSNFKSWLWFGQLYSVVTFWFYLNFPSIQEILNPKSYLFEWNKVIVFRTFGSCNFSIETFTKLDDISHSMFDFQWSENFFYVHNFNAFFVVQLWGLHFSCSFHLVLFSIIIHSIHKWKNPLNHIYFYFIYAECIGSLLFWIGIFCLLHCN